MAIVYTELTGASRLDSFGKTDKVYETVAKLAGKEL